MSLKVRAASPGISRAVARRWHDGGALALAACQAGRLIVVAGPAAAGGAGAAAVRARVPAAGREGPDRRAGREPSSRWRRASAALGRAQGRVADQLEYKTQWAGGQIIVADRWFASSKQCSGCGAVRAKLPLSERTYRCDTCGLVLDRDLNAARNLAAYGRRQIAGSGPEIANGRGAESERSCPLTRNGLTLPAAR